MSTEADTGTVLNASDDNTPMRSHIVCGACYQISDAGEAPMGTPALCGERVLGRRSKAADCPACLRAKSAHRMMHMGGRA